MALAGETAREADVVQQEKGAGRRNVTLIVVSLGHALNHMQGRMTSIVYPLMMAELGFGYAQLGMITAVHSLAGNALQATYGFLVQFCSRAVLLGSGCLVLGLGALGNALAQNYIHVMAGRVISGMGTSAQHPVGSTLIATFFQKARARALTFHNVVGNVGDLIGPLLAALILYMFGWRQVFVLIAVLGLVMGLAFFLLQDMVRPAAGHGRSRFSASLEAYKRCLTNRNFLLISLVELSGAAGRGQGINMAYLVPHFQLDMGVNEWGAALLMTALTVGSLVGPLGLAWMADRYSGKKAIQLALLGSTATSLLLAWQTQATPWFVLTLIAYGAAVSSRNPLTQALMADRVGPQTTDAAFSLFYFIGFISSPFWTLLTGLIMEFHGFAIALTVVSGTYLVGTALLAGVSTRSPDGTR